MKTNTILLALFILTNSICKSQITSDYPFKTYLDSSNNLYVTGNKFNIATNSIDILIEKYDYQLNQLWSRYFPNPYGNDMGLDLAVDEQGNTFVTGYIFNSETNSNDIITLKYNSAGILQWDKVYNNLDDDKGMGIDLTFNIYGEAIEVFISGYITSPTTGKDFIIIPDFSLGKFSNEHH